MCKVRSAFLKHQNSIVVIQCLWRCKQAKRELRKLKHVRFSFFFPGGGENELEVVLTTLLFFIYLSFLGG